MANYTYISQPTVSPDELRAWRAKNGFAQEALAGVLGITGKTIRNWEAEVYPIPVWLGYALKGILGCMEQRETEEKANATH